MAEAIKIRLTDRKRESILDAAVQEFASSGFDNTSMDRISEVAKVSKRTVYNHFPSKEDLFAAIVERLLARCNPVEQYSYDPLLPLEPQLLSIAQSLVELSDSAEFLDLGRVILPRFLQTPELSRQLLGDCKPGERALIQWIQTAQRAGRLKPMEPEVAARQFHGLINTFAFWPQILGAAPPLSPEQKQAVIQSTVSMFLDHYVVR
ncbi:TetR/AcrR family transcriptional regulator [Planctomicrobium sp. SH668]|uniref:TetR/AcrR family transcriptional regulator n=1 Tax=Planctomicrobium sp. SH668 TaxID=3448126 RepID=UPI003F5B18E5